MNTVILNNVKLQSINYVDFTARASNKLRVDSISLGRFYIFDVTHDEIMETVF